MNLAELIEAHKGSRSYADLERDCGGAPKAARIHQLATQPQKNFPDPPTIFALARALRVPEVTVVLAAAETLGIDTRRSTPPLFDRLPIGTEHLNEDQIRALVDTARSFIEANGVSGAQRAALRNLIVHGGVQILNGEGKRVVGDVDVDAIIDLLDDEASVREFERMVAHALAEKAAVDEEQKDRPFAKKTLVPKIMVRAPQDSSDLSDTMSEAALETEEGLDESPGGSDTHVE